MLLNIIMQSTTKKLRILIVEDDENQRALYQEELADEGYDILTASDGREAIKIVQEDHPDLVVTDVNMPVMDGLDMISRLIEVDRSIPIVIHTAYASYREQFSSWSADAYVVKTSDLTELKTTVKNLLNASAA